MEDIFVTSSLKGKRCDKIQYNSAYPDAGYTDRQLSGSAWPSRVKFVEKSTKK